VSDWGGWELKTEAEAQAACLAWAKARSPYTVLRNVGQGVAVIDLDASEPMPAAPGMRTYAWETRPKRLAQSSAVGGDWREVASILKIPVPTKET